MRCNTDAARLRRRAAAILLLAAVGVPLAGCGRGPSGTREATRAVSEFLDDLRSHKDDALRRRASCLVSSEGVRDARLRFVESAVVIRLGTLDTLATRYEEAHRAADSLYAATPDSAADVETRFQEARDRGRRAALARAARRAGFLSVETARATPSLLGSAPGASAILPLESVRAHVLVRFAGPAIGPGHVDRDMIVRLLRSPDGPWVVYAFDLASDAPGPLPF